MKRLFAIALLLAGATARAQSDVPQVTAHIQPDSVMIGDRFDLMVDVEKDLVQVVQFPEFEDKPGSAIELHKEHPVDTLERDGRHLKLRKRYTLAAFEEGSGTSAARRCSMPTRTSSTRSGRATRSTWR